MLLYTFEMTATLNLHLGPFSEQDREANGEKLLSGPLTLLWIVLVDAERAGMTLHFSRPLG